MKKTINQNSLFYKFYLYYNLYIHHNCLKKRKHYSQSGEDVFIVEYFKNRDLGFYVDIGCFHPIMYSNTAALYSNGWNGINIDMNQTSIDLFNIIRKKDKNFCVALSNTQENREGYIDHFFSPINSLNKEFSNYTSKNISNRDHKTINLTTYTFEKFIESKNINVPNIDLLNIDVETFDFQVLEGFNLNKFKPELICIEMLNSKGDLQQDKYEAYLSKFNYSMINKIGLNGFFELQKK